MNKRWLLAALSCLISLITGWVVYRGGRQQGTAERRKIVIGLSLDTLSVERWQKDRDLFVARANELGAEVLVQTANNNDSVQISNVESLISRKVDVVVLVPHDGQAMAKAVRMCHDAGIPIISYDRLITDSDPDLYVTFDSVKVGEIQAQFLLKQFPKKDVLRIVRVNGAKSDHNSSLFREGQDNVLAPYEKLGKVEIIHDDWTEDWMPANAKKIVQAAITQHGPNFDAVLAANDGTAGGAIQALLEDGLSGKIAVTGQDADLAACQRIVHGTQTMTVYKPLKKLARRAAELAVDIATGKPVVATRTVFNGKIQVPSVFVDIIPVTKENMRDTVIRDGYQNERDIYYGS